MPVLRLLFLGFLSLGLLTGMSTSARALATYSYSGNPYDTISGSAYSTMMSVSGGFTIDVPLAAGLTNFDVMPLLLDFIAFDGIQSFTPIDLWIDAEFYVNTDASGNIVKWAIYIDRGTPFGYVASCNLDVSLSAASLCLATMETVIDLGADYAGGGGSIVGSPGSWTLTITPIPEPGTALLVGLGLVGFGWRGRANA